MRILFAVHQFFPKYYTGTERFVLNVTKQLIRMGHSAEVITYEETGSSNYKLFEKEKIVSREYTYEGIPVIALRHSSPPKDITFGITDNGLEFFLRKFVKRRRFDIIHIGHPLKMGILAWVGKNLGIPVIATLTDFWLLCQRIQLWKPDGALCLGPKDGEECLNVCHRGLAQEQMSNRLDKTREFFDICDAITSPSQFLIDMFHQNSWDREIQLVRHGIDYSFVGPRSRRHYAHCDSLKIGYLGAVLYHKGVHVLVEAFRGLRSDRVSLDIWGGCFHEGGYYKRLLKLAKKDGRIRFKGEYNYTSIFKVLNEVDLIVVPSLWWENSPLTILTAFAAGIPAIASNIGGMAEFVQDGKTGYTFEVGDPKSLTLVIEKILEDPSVLNGLKNNITAPRIEEEVFYYEGIYNALL